MPFVGRGGLCGRSGISNDETYLSHCCDICADGSSCECLIRIKLFRHGGVSVAMRERTQCI